jgi:hypothetical protein
MDLMRMSEKSKKIKKFSQYLPSVCLVSDTGDGVMGKARSFGLMVILRGEEKQASKCF